MLGWEKEEGVQMVNKVNDFIGQGVEVLTQIAQHGENDGIIIWCLM